MLVGPPPNIDGAQLFVKREELDVNGTQSFVDGGWFPRHLAIEGHCCFSHQMHNKVTVGTEKHKS